LIFRIFVGIITWTLWRRIEVGTFASAASGRESEQKGVAAVGKRQATRSRCRAPQQAITGLAPDNN